MNAFEKLCLVVGKIVVFFVTFLSCFYIVDLICTSIRPYIDMILEWLIRYRDGIVIACFAMVFFSWLVLTLLNRQSDNDNYRRGRRKEG